MSEKNKDIKNIVLGAAAYTSASIFGPLVFFGGLGLILDKKFDTKPVLLLISIGISFIFTNAFLFKKIKKMSKVMEVYGEKMKKKKAEEKIDQEK